MAPKSARIFNIGLRFGTLGARFLFVFFPAKYPNVDGGICNGITSPLSDESDIGFCETEDPYQSWRWSEQWLPHAAWFLLAIR